MYSGEKVLVGLEHGKAADYAMLRTFMEPDHLRRWHSKMAHQFKSQLPGLRFQQRP
jgi:hypothetical protein